MGGATDHQPNYPGPKRGTLQPTHMTSPDVWRSFWEARGSACTCPLPIPAAYVTASSAAPRSSRNAASISASVPGPYLDVVSRRTRLTRPPPVMLLSPRPRPSSAMRPSRPVLPCVCVVRWVWGVGCVLSTAPIPPPASSSPCSITSIVDVPSSPSTFRLASPAAFRCLCIYIYSEMRVES